MAESNDSIKEGAMRRVIVVGFCVLLASCATKRYGRLQPLSAGEIANYNCHDIAIELSKVDAFDDQVEHGSNFNAASALGDLGDFGIGNANEKHAALESARERRADLRKLAAQRSCNPDLATAVPSAAEAVKEAPTAGGH